MKRVASDTDVPLVDEELRLDTRRSSSMFVSLHLKEITASLFLDEGVSADECRDTAHELARISLQNLRGSVVMGASGSSELQAHAVIERLEAQDLLHKEQQGPNTFFTTGSAAAADDVLEARVRFNRSTVRIVGDAATLEPSALVGPLQKLGTPQAVFVQQNAHPGVCVVLAWMKNYDEASHAVTQLRAAAPTPGIHHVDLGPSLDASAKCFFRGFKLYISPALVQSLLRFFVVAELNSGTHQAAQTAGGGAPSLAIESRGGGSGALESLNSRMISARAYCQRILLSCITSS